MQIHVPVKKKKKNCRKSKWEQINLHQPLSNNLKDALTPSGIKSPPAAAHPPAAAASTAFWWGSGGSGKFYSLLPPAACLAIWCVNRWSSFLCCTLLMMSRSNSCGPHLLLLLMLVVVKRLSLPIHTTIFLLSSGAGEAFLYFLFSFFACNVYCCVARALTTRRRCCNIHRMPLPTCRCPMQILTSYDHNCLFST